VGRGQEVSFSAALKESSVFWRQFFARSSALGKKIREKIRAGETEALAAENCSEFVFVIIAYGQKNYPRAVGSPHSKKWVGLICTLPCFLKITSGRGAPSNGQIRECVETAQPAFGPPCAIGCRDGYGEMFFRREVEYWPGTKNRLHRRIWPFRKNGAELGAHVMAE